MSLASDILHAADPVAWARDACGFTCDDWQERVLRSRKDMILLLHRQSGKTTVTSLVALHLAIHQPGSLTLLLAPSLRQSREQFNRIRTFLRRLSPAQILETENQLSCEFQSNGSRIIAIPGASPDAIRGFTPDLVIEDEAAFVKDETHEALMPSLLVSKGRLILLSTPAGPAGHFHAHWTSGNPDWERIKLAVTENPRIDKGQLDKLRRMTPAHRWKSEYLVQFHDSLGQLFSSELIESMFDKTVVPLWTPQEEALLYT
jgi:hypothetical protein